MPNPDSKTSPRLCRGVLGCPVSSCVSPAPPRCRSPSSLMELNFPMETRLGERGGPRRGPGGPWGQPGWALHGPRGARPPLYFGGGQRIWGRAMLLVLLAPIIALLALQHPTAPHPLQNTSSHPRDGTGTHTKTCLDKGVTGWGQAPAPLPPPPDFYIPPPKGLGGGKLGCRGCPQGFPNLPALIHHHPLILGGTGAGCLCSGGSRRIRPLHTGNNSLSLSRLFDLVMSVRYINFRGFCFCFVF